MKDGLYEEIEARVQLMTCVIEQQHGTVVAKSVNRLLDGFIDAALTEAIVHNIHPGRMISAFIEVIKAIDQSSEEMVVTHKNKNIQNN